MADRLWHPRALLRGLALAASLVGLAWLGNWMVDAGILSERWIDIEVSGHGWTGYLVFLGMGSLATALGFPRQVVAFLAGYAFGAVVGTEIALLAAILGCIAAFAYARLFARSLVHRGLLARAQRLDDFLNAAPFQMTLIIRLLPVGSNVVTNLFAGMTRVRFLPFLAGSSVGYLPQTLAFAIAGSGVHVAPVVNAAIAGAMLVVSGYVGIRLYRRHRHGAALERSIDDALDEGSSTGGRAI
ncbi:MAG TPA: VTT domain-containing protein [Casimicrobiaceae bacterium]